MPITELSSCPRTVATLPIGIARRSGARVEPGTAVRGDWTYVAREVSSGCFGASTPPSWRRESSGVDGLTEEARVAHAQGIEETSLEEGLVTLPAHKLDDRREEAEGEGRPVSRQPFTQGSIGAGVVIARHPHDDGGALHLFTRIHARPGL